MWRSKLPKDINFIRVIFVEGDCTKRTIHDHVQSKNSYKVIRIKEAYHWARWQRLNGKHALVQSKTDSSTAVTMHDDGKIGQECVVKKVSKLTPEEKLQIVIDNYNVCLFLIE